MGVQDESMLLDSQEVPWLGKALMAFNKKMMQSPKMFPQDYYTLMKHWKEALVHIGLQEDFAVPYQLRHAGASWDRFKKFRTQLEVKMRGRWASDSSMTRYEKHALLSQIFGRQQQTCEIRSKSLWAFDFDETWQTSNVS